MSLLLNGAKTMTIAGTEMQCLEIYTGEAYTLPIYFTDSGGNAANCTGWSISPSAKYYTVDTVTYPSADSVNLGNITALDPQPSNTNYTLTAAFTNAAAGSAYLYVGNNITGNGVGNTATPTIALANNTANSTLVIVTLGVSRTSNVSGQTDINREPLGFIVRYQ